MNVCCSINPSKTFSFFEIGVGLLQISFAHFPCTSCIISRMLQRSDNQTASTASSKSFTLNKDDDVMSNLYCEEDGLLDTKGALTSFRGAKPFLLHVHGTHEKNKLSVQNSSVGTLMLWMTNSFAETFFQSSPTYESTFFSLFYILKFQVKWLRTGKYIKIY